MTAMIRIPPPQRAQTSGKTSWQQCRKIPRGKRDWANDSSSPTDFDTGIPP
jgi:hypothetical protein